MGPPHSSPATQTLTLMHTHSGRPAPWGTEEGGWVSPDYLSRFQQMVEELSSWDHTALLSSLPHLKSPTSPPPKQFLFLPFLVPASSRIRHPSFTLVTQKHPSSNIPFPKCWTRPPHPSCGSLAESRTLEQIMPSDFLTPFLELDEEFCKVRVSKKRITFETASRSCSLAGMHSGAFPRLLKRLFDCMMHTKLNCFSKTFFQLLMWFMMKSSDEIFFYIMLCHLWGWKSKRRKALLFKLKLSKYQCFLVSLFQTWYQGSGHWKKLLEKKYPKSLNHAKILTITES